MPNPDIKYVWYVYGENRGECPTLFSSKYIAEQYARELFPNEEPDKRYARIFMRVIMED